MKCRRETEQQKEKWGESMSKQQNCILCYPQGALKAFPSLSKLISFIQISVPELWVPEDVCETTEITHISPIFWPHGCNVIMVIRVPLVRGPRGSVPVALHCLKNRHVKKCYSPQHCPYSSSRGCSPGCCPKGQGNTLSIYSALATYCLPQSSSRNTSVETIQS